jgi:ribose-phosphate pyrophosphokinase
MNERTIKIIDGTSNSELSDSIAKKIDPYVDTSNAIVSTFSDGESRIEILENMRGCDVFVIQPTSPPTNNHIIQLCLILDALKRSNCWRVTAVIPYFGYARQDKKLKPRVPISAKAIADIIQAVGVDRILTMDLHSNQIQAYFDIPVDNLFSSTIFVKHLKGIMENDKETNYVLVSPDVGGVARTVHFAKKLGTETSIIYKARTNPNEISKMILLGNVRDKTAVIIDDMIDTGGTLCKASTILKDAGAKKIIAYASHGVFSGNAIDNINNSSFSEIFVTDSIKQKHDCEKIKTLTCSNLLSEAILNIHNETSVSCLF